MGYIVAHAYSSNHKDQLLTDKKCGCFFCIEIFSPKEIREWIEDTIATAICPYCGVDSVIGECSGFLITEEFL
ncbi:MAG: cytoplasmic protein, partial [Eubacteriales bacterium]|nr:cytoplasmic protein [Eubacteriales bacterium]